MNTVLRGRFLCGTAALSLVLTGAACGSPSTPSVTPTSGTTATSSHATGPQQAGVSQLWVQTWTAAAEGRPDAAAAVAASPDGATVFVTGSGPTIAYAAATGKQLWIVSDDPFESGGASLAVSDDGAAVFVTGTTSGEAGDYVTEAYAATTGKRLWTSRYNGPGNGADTAASVVARGSLVVVNGTSAGSGTGADFATVAYDPATGKQLWAARYDGPSHGDEGWFPSGVHSLAIDAKGQAVYITGGSAAAADTEYATVAYDAAGKQLWVSRYADPGAGADMGAAVAVAPDGSTVVVTGMSEAAATKTDVATIGYAGGTGKQLWASRYNGPANQNEGGGAIAFRPDGTAVFVAGTSEGAETGREDFAVLAYETTTGKQLWATRYDGPTGGDDNAFDLAVGADGSSVVVVGRTVPQPMLDEYATVSLRATTGEKLWEMTYGVAEREVNGNRSSEAHAVAVGKDGTVYVTGGSGRGYATVAYRD